MTENIFYSLDLIGISPQLFVFNNKRYKSKLSCILSIIIILSSLAFGIYSLYQYLKYDNPIIIYTKDNDEKTTRKILLKDLILMFQLIDSIDSLNFRTINKSIAYFEGYYGVIFNNGTIRNTSIEIENCKSGNTFDSKFKGLKETKYGRKMEEFYCLNSKYENSSLFYDPKIGFSYIILYIKMKNNSIYTPENINSIIISENNIIDHYNKDAPITKSYVYHYTEGFSSSQYSKFNYNFQYIKYESDEGMVTKKTKSLSGITFSDLTILRTQQNYNLIKNNERDNASLIGAIEFNINKSNFDNYRRSYQKLQSLLAEVMSVVSLLFEIGRQITNILCYKMMSADIVGTVLNKHKNKKYILNHQNSKSINSYLNDKKKEFSISDRKEIKNEKNDNIIIIQDLIKENENEFEKTKNNNNLIRDIKANKINEDNRPIKQINIFDIIKSFFCFKDYRTKFINLSQDIIYTDLSIEIIMERFLNLQKIFLYLSKKEKIEFSRPKRFKEIYECMLKLNNEIVQKIPYK